MTESVGPSMWNKSDPSESVYRWLRVYRFLNLTAVLPGAASSFALHFKLVFPRIPSGLASQIERLVEVALYVILLAGDLLIDPF